MTSKLVASCYTGGGNIWVYLDNTLLIKNSDSISIELEEGCGYIIHWFVRGTPGSSYSITISSPRDAQFQLTRNVVRSGKDYGSIQFTA